MRLKDDGHDPKGGGRMVEAGEGEDEEDEEVGQSGWSRHERARCCCLFSHARRVLERLCMTRALEFDAQQPTWTRTATAMSTAAGPSATRGDLTLQPSYFTSSLYVEPLREDVTTLVNLFAQRYVETWPPTEPFALFKRIWSEQGWCWLHFRVLDARSREAFVNVTERILVGAASAQYLGYMRYSLDTSEHLADGEPLLSRVVALFALYTFHRTQPTTRNPPIHSVSQIAIPLGTSPVELLIGRNLTIVDIYHALRALPSSLTSPEILPLQPYATYVLKVLVDAETFHILPRAELRPYKPSVLPREVFVTEEKESAILATLAGDSTASTVGIGLKKKGRPSRRDKQKKAKDALAALEKYLEKNTIAHGPEHMPVSGPTSTADQSQTTHRMVVHPPSATREQYRFHKKDVLGMLDPPGAGPISSLGEPTRSVNAGKEALQRANAAILARLKMIDEMAAEQGLEVGGEGGEKTGLARVERAVQQLTSGDMAARAGLLGLLDGAGLDASWEM